MTLVVLALVLVVNVGSSGAEVQAPVCPPPVAPLSGTAAPTTHASAGAAEPTPEQVLVCVGADAITGATYSH
jgi:hypothetical protein